jgi:hypothetical protein
MVFRDLFPSSQNSRVFLGSPEAEAEASAQSRISLIDVYEDFHDLFPELTGEKFIIVGRKGSGKSAFAEYVCARSKTEPNLFTQFIRASEFNIEKDIQLGQASDATINSESFFLWLIYTNILRLFSHNSAIEDNKDYGLLRQFLQKNAGYINIKDFEIKALVEKHGFDVSIEQFKRFFRATFNRNIEIKSERAPYYKLLPHLEEVVIKTMCSAIERRNCNSYALFFDDLDVWFNANNQASADSLISLIRICRRVNNEVFGKHSIQAKAIILLRDDIEAYLASRYADSAKIFSSYSSRINWYQEEYASNSDFEDKLNLKKFINRRIIYAFDKARLACNSRDPWSELVGSSISDRSSFKHIVNQTFFRPRDLLLFFKPLENGKFKFPLSRHEINTLIGSYAEELAKEVKGELSSFFTTIQVETIFNALSVISKNPQSYSQALSVIEEHCKDVNGSELLEYLFDRSIIGTSDTKNWYWFKCRQPIGSSVPLRLDKMQQIVVQYGIKAYVSQRYA